MKETPMAKEQKAPAPQTEAPIRPPEGFQRQGSVSGAPWFKLAEGAVLQGKLLGKTSRKDPKSPSGTSFFFQVETSDACKATEGKGADAKIVSVDAGSAVNLNYTKKTAESLDPFIPQILTGASVDVWVHVKKKLTTQSGNSFWDMDVAVKFTGPVASAESDDNDGPGFDEEV